MVPTEDTLTEQELTVMQLLADGKRPKDIAIVLHVTENVVNIHLVRIREKLDSRTTYNALATVIRQGLID